MRHSDRVRTSLRILGALFIFLLLWEAVVRIVGIREFILPGPVAVALTLWTERALIIKNLWPTLIMILLSFVISVTGGFATGVAVHHSRIFREAVLPLLVGAQSIPKIALAPLIVIWFGLDAPSRILLAFLIAYFPMVINTAAGLSNVDEELVRMGRAFMSNRWHEFYKIRVPAALPFIFSGMKISVGATIIGVVVSEFMSAEAGLGFLTMWAKGLLHTALIIAALAVLSALGIVLYGLVELAERKVLYWERGG